MARLKFTHKKKEKEKEKEKKKEKKKEKEMMQMNMMKNREAPVPMIWSDEKLLEWRKGDFLPNESLLPSMKPILDQLIPDREIRRLMGYFRHRYRMTHARLRKSGYLNKADPFRQSSRNVARQYNGIIAGHAFISIHGGEAVDFSALVFGGPIPMGISAIKVVTDDALFILVVGNCSLLQRLSRLMFHVRFRCIIIAASDDKEDEPDFSTRLFLKKLHLDLRLPVFAFGESYPCWLKALRVYREGLDTDVVPLGIPDIFWLGLWPSELDEHNIPREDLYRWSIKDLSRQKFTESELLPRKLRGPQLALLQRELDFMFKPENFSLASVEALYYCGDCYITDVYLPLKLLLWANGTYDLEFEREVNLCISDTVIAVEPKTERKGKGRKRSTSEAFSTTEFEISRPRLRRLVHSNRRKAA